MNTNPDYEPKRDLWPVYEPWMRDLLAADVRVSWESVQRETRELWAALTHWADWELDLVDLRIHPEDCPDKPDPLEGIARLLYCRYVGIADPEKFTWSSAATHETWLNLARIARDKFEEQS